MPATPPLAVTAKPGKRIDVFPAEAGRLLVRVTVTGCPSVTTNVGPGTCIVGQKPVVIAAGTNVGVPATQPYPHEYTDSPSGWFRNACCAVRAKFAAVPFVLVIPGAAAKAVTLIRATATISVRSSCVFEIAFFIFIGLICGSPSYR